VIILLEITGTEDMQWYPVAHFHSLHVLGEFPIDQYDQRTHAINNRFCATKHE
jgi:hypothetical protein